MSKDTAITKVVFRKYRSGEILALFPYEDWASTTCSSYMHVGQHGGANYVHCIYTTKPATPDEYADLKSELESIGYNLQVIKRKS